MGSATQALLVLLGKRGMVVFDKLLHGSAASSGILLAEPHERLDVMGSGLPDLVP
jgi:hypothetical protein